MTSRPRKAMVLGAGLGMRMRPLTDDRPKPLVKLRGRTLIDHVLDRLKAAGIETVIVNAHYRADQLEQHVLGRNDLEIRISDEREKLLDTGGGVAKALASFGDAPFLIHNVDSIWLDGQAPTLERLMASWDDAHMDSLLLLAPVTNCIGYSGPGDFVMKPDGRLQRRGELQQAPFVFAGVSVAHPRLFADSPEGAFSINRLWDAAIGGKRLHGLRHEGVWMHVGSPEALAEAELRLTSDG